MNITVTGADWSIRSDGAHLDLRCTNETECRAISELIKSGTEYSVEIKKAYKKRSINANDFLWALCTKIAEAYSHDKVIVSKDEIYRRAIKSAGKCDYVAVPEKAVDDLINGWQKNGTGWVAEKVDKCKIDGCAKVCLYYGSSVYDTAEMSRLLDVVIQEAEDVGIDTSSPAEIALLKEEWGK